MIKNVLIAANIGSIRLIIEADQGRKLLIYKGRDILLEIFEPVGREFESCEAAQCLVEERSLTASNYESISLVSFQNSKLLYIYSDPIS
ncbi:MAG: hypothetical protein COB20_12510 [SAR86 cluster bacterium]|uniref:Uncharacterized protein n=1 Tax=SAR86 cluster bacterium TaxID=2030880 RepID=A0A2A4WZE4_9GAMM|nr:MAG: hypothetical protein COB20_12510 [SAR86 cluster bacterium]